MVVTFDTNVLLSATLWGGSVSQKLLWDLIKQNIPIYSTMEILSEFQKVLKRDFTYSDKEVADAVQNVLSFVTLVKPSVKLEVVKDDPNDNIIIECAIESNSKYIITYDLHLLNLREYQKIQIIRPEIARAIF